jgi:hypothetical protein
MVGAAEAKNNRRQLFFQITVRELIDRDGVRSTAALPKLTIFPAILIWQRLVHLYRVWSAGAAKATELSAPEIVIVSSGAVVRTAIKTNLVFGR